MSRMAKIVSYIHTYIYIYIYICVCVCVCLQSHAHLTADTHTHTYTHIHTYVCVFVCVWPQTHTHTHTHTQTHTHLSIYLCMFVYIYIYIYIYIYCNSKYHPLIRPTGEDYKLWCRTLCQTWKVWYSSKDVKVGLIICSYILLSFGASLALKTLLLLFLNNNECSSKNVWILQTISWYIII